MIIVKSDGTADSWAPNSEDIFSDDWYVISCFFVMKISGCCAIASSCYLRHANTEHTA